MSAEARKVLFVGEYEVKLDSKNRLAIPAKWKDKIGMEIMIFDSFDGTLGLRTREGFMSYCEEILLGDQNDKSVRSLRRRLLGSARDIVLDKWYRFVIPAPLVAKLEISDTVHLVGMGDYIEIWNPEKLENWKKEEENQLEVVGERVAKR